MRYRNRAEAGRFLAGHLAEYANRPGVIVLALPRGGVPIGFEVARALHAPLDVFVVRKLGVPGHEELAMGAIATGSMRILNERTVAALGITRDQIEETAWRERHELERREAFYRGDLAPLEIQGKTVILVDDGLATGSSMRAAVATVRKKHPAAVVVAVPVAAEPTCRELRAEADAVVCPETPAAFSSVGQSYLDFSQLSDAEVRELLQQASDNLPPRGKGRRKIDAA